MDRKKIAVIGCGKMGSIIISSFKKYMDRFVVSGIEKKEDRLNELRRNNLDIELFENTRDAGDNDIYILAVKPQDIDTALGELGESIKNAESKVLVASIAAGITISYIKSFLEKYNKNISVARVMPNTAAVVSEGFAAVASDDSVQDEEIKIIRDIFNSMGTAVRMDEKYMDAVTALSGSGPAYFFFLAEAMEKFAVDMGIDRDTSCKLISQTVTGAGKLMAKSDRSFEELRGDVTSPGGTTEAAINYLKENKFAEIFYEALNKAKIRSEELSKTLKIDD